MALKHEVAKDARNKLGEGLRPGTADCLFYVGPLPKGWSPGYSPKGENQTHSIAWVVRPDAWQNRDIISLSDRRLATRDKKLKLDRWVQQEVRVVSIDNMGMPADYITKNYFVRVTLPWDSVCRETVGALVPKPSGANPVAAVPDGQDTREQLMIKEVMDRSRPMADRMASTRAHFKDGFEGSGDKYPSPNTFWV